jgi:hypothetical protein
MDIYVLDTAVTIIIDVVDVDNIRIHGHRHFYVEMYGCHMDKKKTILNSNFHLHSEKGFLELITQRQQIQYPTKRRIGMFYVGLV